MKIKQVAIVSDKDKRSRILILTEKSNLFLSGETTDLEDAELLWNRINLPCPANTPEFLDYETEEREY